METEQENIENNFNDENELGDTHHGNAIYWWLEEGKGDANNKKQRTSESVPKPKMQITILEQTEKEQEGKEQ